MRHRRAPGFATRKALAALTDAGKLKLKSQPISDSFTATRSTMIRSPPIDPHRHELSAKIPNFRSKSINLSHGAGLLRPRDKASRPGPVPVHARPAIRAPCVRVEARIDKGQRKFGGQIIVRVGRVERYQGRIQRGIDQNTPLWCLKCEGPPLFHRGWIRTDGWMARSYGRTMAGRGPRTPPVPARIKCDEAIQGPSRTSPSHTCCCRPPFAAHGALRILRALGHNDHGAAQPGKEARKEKGEKPYLQTTRRVLAVILFFCLWRLSQPRCRAAAYLSFCAWDYIHQTT